MSDKSALIVGATGLIGSQLLELLLDTPYYTRVLAVVREGSELDITHNKLQLLKVDFDDLPGQSDQLIADHVFCCLGTTMKKAGSKEKFKKVDFDYPLQIAKILRANGASCYMLVSALGADKNSKVFYNQVKGEVEEAIRLLNYQFYHIFRPSLLMGHRPEERPGEDAAKLFFNIFGFLFVGPLKKYKAIDSSKVAKAMALYAKKDDQSGTIIHESIELQEF